MVGDTHAQYQYTIFILIYTIQITHTHNIMHNTRKVKRCSTAKMLRKASNCKHTRKPRSRGGKVVGSGGFGCVFRPALRCKSKKQRHDNTVSKLMVKKYIQTERKNIRDIEKQVKSIPNYQRYFLVGNISTCAPGELTESDLENFNDKCGPLKKRNITSKNVNENLDKLSVINLPDGGITMNNVFARVRGVNDLVGINRLMLDLYIHGIINLNKESVFHADIKADNMLYNPATDNVGLIDWGLSFYGKRKMIPKIIQNKPIQFNLPFSVLLLDKRFHTSYESFLSDLRKNENGGTDDDLAEFLLDYVNECIEKRKGHIDTVERIWKYVARGSGDRDTTKTTDVIADIIVPYLLRIVKKFTVDVSRKKRKFDKDAYFFTVFLDNMDTWGFAMTYAPVLEKNLFGYRDTMASIFNTYLLEGAAEPIDKVGMVKALYSDITYERD